MLFVGWFKGLIINRIWQGMLYILTSFWVLRTPKVASLHFLHLFKIFGCKNYEKLGKNKCFCHKITVTTVWNTGETGDIESHDLKLLKHPKSGPVFKWYLLRRLVVFKCVCIISRLARGRHHNNGHSTRKRMPWVEY